MDRRWSESFQLPLYATRRVHIPARLWHNHGVKSVEDRKSRPPLDAKGLEQAALGYAGRYATTRMKLRAYLARKLRERGWAESGAPPLDGLIERMAALGYVDDRAFATARAASLGRRGYGERRVGAALRGAGIEAADAADANAMANGDAWATALRYAERRRIGPFAQASLDRPARERALAAMLRAGHPLGLARRMIAARPGEIPEADEA